MFDLEALAAEYRVSVEPVWFDDRQFLEPEEKIRFHEIVGKRGYIRPWNDELELYLHRPLAVTVERTKKQFKPKNHYDDAIAFTFGPQHIAEAVRLIAGRKRRRMSPLVREAAIARLARFHFQRQKPARQGLPGDQIPIAGTLPRPA